MILNTYKSHIRNGCTDMWNAFMVVNADFTLGSDIPFCPCTAKEVPKKLISYVDAKHLHKITIEKNIASFNISH